MFARNVAMRLRPNSLAEFTRILESEILPSLKKEDGFLNEIILSTTPTGMDVIAISLWDTKQHAEAYNRTMYPEVLKHLKKVLDGDPRVRVAAVISSTLHHVPAAVGVQAGWESSRRRLGAAFDSLDAGLRRIPWLT